ncbi:MAG TPA: histidine kinase N-terminal 7TM domain-containing protein, partial [Anaerolineae bacterium]|nr:histidine kinase N-terminal 7TM domain-containing protein [Anaerolineae bacterium]
AILYHVTDEKPAELWLRMQWVGIALAPAAYLHFADAVLRTTNSFARLRRWGVYGAYALGFVFMALALSSDAVVMTGVFIDSAPHLRPGPLFFVYVGYFALAVIIGVIAILQARSRCLTPTSHRRMTYLLLSSTGPALAVFPYLLLSSNNDAAIPLVSWIALVAGNVTVAIMLIVMGYSVAYFGVLAPDRVVKYRLVRFLFRGPIMAAAVAAAVTLFTKLEEFLGLPSETLTTLAIVFFIVFFQIARGSFQPLLDVILFRQDRGELDYIRNLGDRLLTTTDLQQFLENILTAVADLLRVQRVFIASLDADGVWRLRAHIGPVELFDRALAEMHTAQTQPLENGPVSADGYWAWPLWARGDEGVIGVLAIAARADAPDLAEDESAA